MNWSETRARLIECGIDAAKLPEQLQYRIDLQGANLQGAKLQDAKLQDAKLKGAKLQGADLQGANLQYANLQDIKTNYITIGTHPAPQGDLIGWGKKSGAIVKLLIPADAPRSCATTRKHRAAWVNVLEIDGDVTRLEHSTEYGDVVYEAGEITHADSWDEDRWQECSHGIHFFLTREEAEAWV